MDTKKLADLLYPDAKPIEYWFKKYPSRNLKEGAQTTRFAPSPTGYLHIGGVYTALINATIARQTQGVCFLRIEDTDQKREIEDGVQCILDGFNTFNVGFNEGQLNTQNGVGNYGPYIQSKRVEIYKSFAKEMVQKGMAYPCFCTAEDLSLMRKQQEEQKQNPGYYGKYAKCRDLTFKQVQSNINSGKSWVLRFKCPYTENDKMETFDLIRGKRTIPCNYNDVVIMKSDGIPPYNFAHIVDDTLMGTTMVIRGDEWLPSLTEHLQLFEALGLKAPLYAHISPIQKIDEANNERRKLSKRKDPEADVRFFIQQGYTVQAVFDYLMFLANSNFEDWRVQNPKQPLANFKFEISKLNTSGALFDMVKLNDISKNTISNMSAKQVYDLAYDWAKQYDIELAAIMQQDPKYYISILNIDREIAKPRKDISHWAELKDMYSYMFDNSFDSKTIEFPQNYDIESVKQILTLYPNFFNSADDQSTWFGRIKDLAQTLGFAREVKEFKKDPTLYKGHCGDVSTILRIALTGRTQTPNLYDICMLLGKDRIKNRLKQCLNNL